MIDPVSLLPPDLLALCLSMISMRVINTAKAYHTSPERIYALVSFLGGFLYVILTTSWAGSIWEMGITLFSKIGTVMLATSGIWHWTKKLQVAQDQKAADVSSNSDTLL